MIEHVCVLREKKKIGKQPPIKMLATLHSRHERALWNVSCRGHTSNRITCTDTSPEFAEECFLTEPKAFFECECKGDDDDDEVVWLGWIIRLNPRTTH